MRKPINIGDRSATQPEIKRAGYFTSELARQIFKIHKSAPNSPPSVAARFNQWFLNDFMGIVVSLAESVNKTQFASTEDTPCFKPLIRYVVVTCISSSPSYPKDGQVEVFDSTT